MNLIQSPTVLIVQDVSSLTVSKTHRIVSDKHIRGKDNRSHSTDARERTEPDLESAYMQQVEGNWKQFSGRVQEAWGVLTDDDVDRAEGKLDQLVGTIEEKTGEARIAIARKLNDLASSVQS